MATSARPCVSIFFFEIVRWDRPDSKRYSMEIGLKPQFSGLWRQAVVDAVIDQGPGLPPLKVKAAVLKKGEG
ncbi:hypothetical protein C0995_004175 [Termitomyces sp. Mi166|nr:hypothetical protein C0995_004175 [Termitomyces sp. Mi166\